MKCRRALIPLKVIRWMAFFVYGTLVFWIARVFNPNRSLDFRQIVRLCLACCFTVWRWCSGLHRAKTGSKALAEVGKMAEEHPSCKRKCYFMRSDDRFGFNLLILKLMTSIKLKFRPSKVNGKLGTLYFQVIHDRLTRQIGTGYKVYSHEWGDGGLRLPPQGTERRSYLLGVQVRLRKDVERLRNIITRLQQSCESYTVAQIADIYKQPRSDSSKLGAFLNTTVRHLRKIGKVRLAETYTVILLPIISKPGRDERRQYLNGLHRVNNHLKLIGQVVGCPIKLTTYCARHGWASIARSMNVPLSVISESMGHGSESTTRIYLASLDDTVIDDANRMVINAI